MEMRPEKVIDEEQNLEDPEYQCVFWCLKSFAAAVSLCTRCIACVAYTV